MAGLGNPITTQIITKGIGCEPACLGLITTPFSLLCIDVSLPPEPQMEMYTIPYQPGEIQNIFKPIELIDALKNKELPKDFIMSVQTVKISIDVTDNDAKKETEFGIRTAKPSENTVRLHSLEDTTMSNIKVNVENLRFKTSTIKVDISGLTKIKTNK